ncbi:MAG TPA: sulfurtransferase [Thermomicrobiales bacterium]|nr:sulfurtransferase [Thermomicrobiales bacterium]
MASPASGTPIVDVDWLIGHRNDPAVLIVDVRPTPQYLAGHLPGAISLDVAALRLPASDEQTLAAWTAHLQKGLRAAGIRADQQVIFYEEISGTLAAFGIWLLDVAGLGNGTMLDGGLRAWLAAGQELSQDVTEPARSDIEITLDRKALATADEILGHLDDQDALFQLVDTRGAAEHQSGTIPTSTNIEWTSHLDPATGKLKSPDELRRLYTDVGLKSDAPTATYCAGGFRAAHTYVVLKSLGFTDVQNYAPSWAEWSQRPDTPVATGE